MYTCIDTTAALDEIGKYLQHNESIFSDIPLKALMAALKLIMENNIFCFGNTYWLQTNGCAMGAPPAPPYATLFFAIKENTLLPTFRSSITLYKRYIDDVLGIWEQNHNPTIDMTIWNNFKQELNSFHGLQWDISELSKK